MEDFSQVLPFFCYFIQKSLVVSQWNPGGIPCKLVIYSSKVFADGHLHHLTSYSLQKGIASSFQKILGIPCWLSFQSQLQVDSWVSVWWHSGLCPGQLALAPQDVQHFGLSFSLQPGSEPEVLGASVHSSVWQSNLSYINGWVWFGILYVDHEWSSFP